MRLPSALLALALALSTSAAIAADGAFAPGKPAGVKSAQDFNAGTPLYVLVGAGVIGTAIAIISSTHSNGTPSGSPSGTVVGSSTTSTV